MELKGESRIAASREKVWAALVDPEVLARCIDGVESLEADGENRYRGRLDAKVGPVRAKFSGTVEMTELDPPSRYVLVGEGKGGVAGFARGSAVVTLVETEDGATLLSYTATSQVGGKLAQLGARLVEGAARGYAESFFAKFKEIVEDASPGGETAPAPAKAEAPALPAAAAEEREARGVPPLVWALLLVAAVGLLLFLLLR
ncbi:MAG: CoxG family protein [Thermaurantiacus tibetensis]|uniref:CoxG family protein n=1 Tax=Thermaurantiacus tibetensis TaxID=2759035 RepID=UPI0018907C95|nr:carbon monoxide dehydrogenase subunit G [Thermaurantiacus tibetensis]